MPPAALSASPACSLQLHLLRRPALLSPARLPLHLHLRLRLRLRAAPSPSPDSFAGWSDEDDAAPAPGPFTGLLGPALAGAFFLAGITFAAISIRTNITTAAATPPANGTVKTLSTHSETAVYYSDDDNTSKQEDAAPQVLITSDSKSVDTDAGTNKHPLPLQTNDISTGAPEHDTEHPLESSQLVPHDKYVAPSQPDYFIASDGTESPPPATSMSNLAESSVAAYDSSDKLSGGGPSEGTCNLQETIDSEASFPENQRMDGTVMSNIMVLDSGDVVPIQEISDTAVEAASHHPNEKHTEQNPQLSNEDVISPPRLPEEISDTAVEAASHHPDAKHTKQNPQLSNEDVISPLRLPDYIEHGSAAHMLPSGSDDLPTKGGKPGKSDETLASDQDEGANELEKQNGVSKSTEPDKSFSSAGIPAPSLLSAALKVPAGQIVVPAAIDPTQGNALAALQVLKVIEPSARAGDLCTRREYARWLVVASNCLSRNTCSKVYPAMYIKNVSELAFDDVTTEDPDFPFIQGLAEAGLISSKLSRSNMNIPGNVQNNNNLFSPESPLSRQDLVSWKMALDKRQLPEVDKNTLFKTSGYIDIDKINAAAWPALVADLGAGDQSVTALAFGFTRLFQPDKPVTKGQAALALSTGDSAEVVMEELARIEADKIAELAVNAHGALVAQVEKDINASFERELTREREKIETLEKLAEEARVELDKLRAEREEEKNTLIRGRAAVESEIEVLSKLRCEVEEQLQSVLSKKVEISFEKNRIEKLQKEIENENQAAVQLQYELEVERKALSMARAWAEEEAKKAREHARALEEARSQWERQGIKVVVEGGLEDDASAGVTWANASKEHPVDEAINRAESLLGKLKSISAEMKVRSCHALERVMQHVRSFISSLKQRAAEARQGCTDFGTAAASKAKKLSSEAQGNVYAFGSTIGDKSKRVVGDCKEGLEKFAHRFKTD